MRFALGPRGLRARIVLGFAVGTLLVSGVLVTVTFLTVFLFVVDIVWIRVLSFEPIPGVLQINPQTAKQKQLAPTDW